MSTFTMPSLGADMEAGTLVEWLRHPGDTVKRGEIIAVVETQKGAIEVEVFDEGVIDKLLVEEGTEVPVGTPLALIRGAGEEVAPVEKAKPKAPEVPPQVAAPAGPVLTGIRASPAARRLAAERGVELSDLKGSGPGGAILRADVERTSVPAARRKPEKARAPGLDLGEMRKAIAAAMARSKREIPHYYVNTAIDLTPTLTWLEARNSERTPPERLLISVPLLKATALALREFPELNGFYAQGAFQPSERIHCGMAVALRGGGLIAPAIHDTDRLSLDELMTALRDLVRRVRGGGLRSSELSDPTVTVTSLGERGVETVFGVIYPPQVAIVGFGAPVKRPWVDGGKVLVRTVVTLSLSADHRVSDGHRGALFLAEVDRLLQKPEAL